MQQLWVKVSYLISDSEYRVSYDFFIIMTPIGGMTFDLKPKKMGTSNPRDTKMLLHYREIHGKPKTLKLA